MNLNINNILYQKKGVTISNLAMDLLSKDVGNRIASISNYQKEFQVSRGTMQNAFSYLKEIGAISLRNQGYQGTYIEKIDYKKLQESCLKQEILGIMPLPYSRTYEGFATAIYEQLKDLKFNMAYTRGAVVRLQLVESGIYQFAIVSRYAAEYAIADGRDIECILNFGAGSFLSKHILLLRDKRATGIEDGMKVAYDEESLDQSGITCNLIRNKKVQLVSIRTQQTISALLDGTIDAGVWNYDDIMKNDHAYDLKPIFIEDDKYNAQFSTAVLITKKKDKYLKELLKKKINVEDTIRIMNEVKTGIKDKSF
ncbi:GntR family transcriptional regulator YhfZ [Treponema phagedenis]|uniref:Helix-turn-helix protein n=1 Tax=Treponema phagedenis TaxID=162 RepID=A0A0B7GXH3_TREPH|nr:GntR family transcriptional regulator YhfZ [Treponema phagedenis]NVP23003.1 hypothetical protein [Treponema phagedenis]QEJ95127.1 hypothetical protein FUT79_07885 [Treponema phagedenis]QEJ98201.1 hypothetical protein FUT82_09455 [Treponema phagedenis]QEK01051.1 hypothetical protein FUT84_07725 [Treponema phagedenis]QEK03709.1 hypothetical protein FUT83_07760 [Treponema phagedenis]